MNLSTIRSVEKRRFGKDQVVGTTVGGCVQRLCNGFRLAKWIFAMAAHPEMKLHASDSAVYGSKALQAFRTPSIKRPNRG